MKTTAFDVSDYLSSDEDIVAFLEAALEEGDSGYFVRALGHVAKARGMGQIAKESGLGRESLYKALGENGNPRLDTVMRIMKAMGLELKVERTV